jgi:hypothetical protein
MDLKTSLLVNRQLPEFVRDEYPLFVSFLEAYYEFLETERYSTVDGEVVSQKNNLIEKLKDLKNISDIDFSLNDFEEQFFNTFISYLPKETVVSKDFLIKNILPLYQSKGTQKSFQLLFRLLFGEEIQIDYPGDKVLRASDGKWTIENIIRTELEIYNQYVSDGLTKVYNLPYVLEPTDIQVYVDDVLFEDYYVRKELKKIYFNVAPALNSKIKVVYLGAFITSIFNNRQIVGITSSATAVIEKVARRNIGGLNFYQFFIDEKNTKGTFRNGEIIEVDVIVENNIIPFFFQTLSDVESINVISPGSGYKTGDIAILRGSSSVPAVAIIEEVSSGKISDLSPKVGNFGAGYKVGNEITANGYSSNTFLAEVDAVDDSGTLSPNTFSFFNKELISDYLSINISDPDYGFTQPTTPTVNLSSVFGDAFTTTIITNLGPATNASIIISEISSNVNVQFVANSTLLYDDIRISDAGSIGTIKIINPGSGYSVGDEVIFTNTEYFSGQGARAFVSSVTITGGINRITVQDGGYNYRKDYLPAISINGSGSGAVLEIEHFMGQGADFVYETGDGIEGKIISIKVINPGKGYTVTPIVDLKFSGDGLAVATANIRSSFVKLPGRWITSDGLLSSDEIRLQGKDYYVDFSYVITSQIEFQKYRSIVKDLLNPVGAINYAVYNIPDQLSANLDYEVLSQIDREVAGTINVASGFPTVWGTNTYFVVANTIGLLTEGSYILVNSEIRIVNSIINNTTITVSEPYSYSTNDTTMTLVYKPYRAITTEYWRELAISIEGPRTVVLTTEENY